MSRTHHKSFCSPKQLIRTASSRHRASPRASSRIRAHLFSPSFAASCAIARDLRVALCGAVDVDEMSIGMRARAMRRHTATPDARDSPDARDARTQCQTLHRHRPPPSARMAS